MEYDEGHIAPAAVGASACGGTPPIPPPAHAQVSGQIGVGLRIESDTPARVTTLEASGDAEIDVDSRKRKGVPAKTTRKRENFSGCCW